MNLGNFNLSMFGPRLMLALGYTIGALFFFALFPMISGAGNTIHLESRGEGSCETVNGGVRFDKLALQKTVSGNPLSVDETNWGSATAGDVVTIVQNSGTAGECQFPSGTNVASATYYLPTGETLTLTAKGTPDEDIDATVATWVGPSSIFQDQPGLVAMVVGAVALVIGIGPLVIIGALGYQVLSYFKSDGMGVSMMLMAALGAVIVVSLLGTFVDFISVTYDAIDAARFTVYTQSLASLAGTIRQFWGVIFVASFLGLGGMIAYQGYQKVKGTGPAQGESQMAN